MPTILLAFFMVGAWVSLYRDKVVSFLVLFPLASVAVINTLYFPSCFLSFSIYFVTFTLDASRTFSTNSKALGVPTVSVLMDRSFKVGDLVSLI